MREHSELWKAIDGNKPFEEIKKMIDRGADLSEAGFEEFDEDPEIDNLFTIALRYNTDLNLIKYLVDKGFSPKEKLAKDNDRDVLISALMNQNPDIGRYIIDCNQDNIKELVSDSNIKVAGDITMLMWAASFSPLEVVKYFMSLGATVKPVSKLGNVLHFAANNRLEVFKYLVDAGADLTVKNNKDEDILRYAAQHTSDPEIIKYLIKEKGFSAKTVEDGKSAFILAGANPNLDVIDAFIECGANIHEVDESGINILVSAAFENTNPQVIRYLAYKGLSVKQILPNNLSLMHFATNNKNPEIIKTLLDLGCAPDIVNSNKETPLMMAASDNPNPGISYYLIKAGASLTQRDDSGWTPLHRSIQNRNHQLYKMFLDMGADPKTENDEGADILKLALRYGDLNMVKEIIGVCPTLDKVNNGLTSVMYAASNPDISVLEFLDNIGCDLKNSADPNAFSILYYAIRNNPNPEMLDFLDKRGFHVKDDLDANLYAATQNHFPNVWQKMFELGLDPDYTDENGKTLLMLALSNDNPDFNVIYFLASNDKDINRTNINGYTALHWAVLKEDPRYTDILIRCGADINAKSNNGESPLALAAERTPNPWVSELLLRSGANVNDIDGLSLNILLRSAYNPNGDMIKYFIDKGADKSIKDRDGRNLLLVAIRANADLDTIKYILSLGFSVNDKDNFGIPAIAYAANINMHVDVIKYLESLGADINFKTDKNVNLLLFAARNNPEIKVYDYLISRGMNINEASAEGERPAWSAAANVVNPKVLDFLISKGADVKGKDRLNRTILMMAAGYNPNPAVVEYLLGKGYDLSDVDAEGANAVVYAAENPNIQVLEALLKKGGDIHTTDAIGYNLLMHSSNSDSYLEMAKYLLEKGIDVNARTEHGNTALMFAADRVTDPRLVEMLIAAGADINAEDDAGHTALFYAERDNPNPAVAMLLKKYATMIQPTSRNFGVITPSKIN